MYVTTPSTSVTVPWVSDPAVTAVTVSACPDSFAGPATSLARRSSIGMASGSPAAAALSGPATGGSLTSLTVIVTGAGAESERPSDAMNVNRSAPL